MRYFTSLSIAELQRIAESARKKFQEKSISKIRLSKLYSKYSPEIDGVKFVSEAEKIFPKLNCGLASVYLQDLLGGEIIQGTYGSQHHTFLFVDNTVVDITADQYGGPSVYVGALQKPWGIKI